MTSVFLKSWLRPWKNINQNSFNSQDNLLQQQQENCLNTSYLGFSASQNTCLSFVTNGCSSLFNILSWFSGLIEPFGIADKLTRKAEITEGSFLSVLITNVVPIFSYQPQHTNVCFWYFPPSLRDLPDGEERRERLHKVMTHQSARFEFPCPLRLIHIVSTSSGGSVQIL